ncbi:hypothetical protein PF002_g30093 [Phytophthora fragariae]|uniref:RxLR effector protein n=1 Tax=Phytophthora fragariae TaxID=53985 RepID=A0A6A3VN63_9STRA|nr:hypothetical protein PF002_g30093 [Phytophthora fragariae]KAE9272030.1 hypothetical protein PF001_g28119 [Phytophthora fragariae]
MSIALPTLTSPAFISVSIAVCMLSGVAPSASVADSWSALLVSSSESASNVTDTSINPASHLITLVLTRSRSVPASAVPGASPPSCHSRRWWPSARPPLRRRTSLAAPSSLPRAAAPLLRHPQFGHRA